MFTCEEALSVRAIEIVLEHLGLPAELVSELSPERRRFKRTQKDLAEREPRNRSGVLFLQEGQSTSLFMRAIR